MAFEAVCFKGVDLENLQKAGARGGDTVKWLCGRAVVLSFVLPRDIRV